MPIISRQEGVIAYHIPFEAPLQRTELEIAPSGSPLEGPPQMLTIEATDPQFIHYGSGIPALPDVAYGVAAVHENFESVVSLADPARPGEILHFYMTGLGAV